MYGSRAVRASRAVHIAAACLCLGVVIGCQQGREPPARFGAVPAAPLDEEAKSVRFQATIYEMRMPPERIGSLDAAQLAAVDFDAVPPSLGDPPKALYRIDQYVSLAWDRVVISSDEQSATDTGIADRKPNPLGVSIDFRATRIGPRRLDVTSKVELSVKTDGGAAVAEGAPAAIIRKTTLGLKGPVELGWPSVLISADASARDKDGKAVVYVARIILGAAPSEAGEE